MISISMRDLRLIDDLAHLNEIQMLDIKNDGLVHKYLAMFGFDLDYGIYYGASKHVDMSGKIAVGFRICGEVEINKRFVDGPFATIADKLVAYSYTDRSWMEELAELSGKSPDFKDFADDGLMAFEETTPEYAESDYEEDYLEVERQIKQLEELRDFIRGPM